MVAIHNMTITMIGDMVEDIALVEVGVAIDLPVVEVMKISKNHHQVCFDQLGVKKKNRKLVPHES